MASTIPFETLPDDVRRLRARFEAEVEPHRADLWRYCRGLTGSPWEAEDLVQETLQRALGKLAGIWQPVSARAYLFRVATNAWIDRVRREGRWRWEEVGEDAATAEPDAELRVRAHEAVARVVTLLPPLQRVVFLLCESLGFRAREAADLLGSTEGAVKAALHRARVRLASAEPTARSAPGPLEPDALVRRFIAAFDARDADALAALLHEDAVTSIVGSADEFGREVSRRQSLAEWAAEPGRQWAEWWEVEGRRVVLALAEAAGGRGLLTVIDLERAGEMVVAQRNYYYCPELLEELAGALGIPALTHGHQYAGS